MAKEYRSASDILREKYEERGWDQETQSNIRTQAKIEPLPLSEEEYRKLSFLLAKLTIQDRDPNLCETYFELQRRAHYGNRYFPIEELSEIEEEMFSIGTEEIINGTETIINNTELAKPLPLSEEEYRKLSFLISELALQDKDSKLYEMYYELQKRAYHGNRFFPVEELSKIEEEMFDTGLEEIIESTERRKF